MIVFYSTKFEKNQALLDDHERIHCGKVLRKKTGDFVFVTDGKGTLYSGTIGSISKKEIWILQLEEVSISKKGHRRAIAIAPTKNIDRLEWFIEKSTELGITDIYPFLSHRSERKAIKPLRLEKILVSAMKQSKNFNKPTLHPLDALKNVMRYDFGSMSKYIAHCMEPELSLHKLYETGSDAIVLIGPEGDFTEEEVSLSKTNNWTEISLGSSRLRTETAGIVACHLLNL